MDDIDKSYYNDYGAIDIPPIPGSDLEMWANNEKVQEANIKFQGRNFFIWIVVLVVFCFMRAVGLGNQWLPFVVFGLWLAAWVIWALPELLKVMLYGKKVRDHERSLRRLDDGNQGRPET